MGHPQTRSRLKNAVPPGTTDKLGLGMRVRDYVIRILRSVYEKSGFTPHDTPTIENEVVFDGHHGEGEKLIFRLEDNKKHRLVLRYDLTVPLARVASSHPDLPRPYKRYQFGYVFRDDKPDKGHFREFMQCDGDIIGASSLLADADIISVACRGLCDLGFRQFVIRVNHRMIIQAIAARAGITGKDGILKVQRAMDYADKVTKAGLEGIREDLKRRRVGSALIESIMGVIAISGSLEDMLQHLQDNLHDQPAGLTGIAELRKIFSYLPDEVLSHVRIDLTLARGADYYTGFILEGVIPGVPIGAVLGGGRFDNLVGAFGAPPEPAVGMAFGLDRILAVMKELDMLKSELVLPDKVLVAYCGNNDSTAMAFRFAQQLRNAGINVDLSYDPLSSAGAVEQAKLRGCQLAFCVNGKEATLTHALECRSAFEADVRNALGQVLQEV
ncbi:MAG: ATP phosphoribosyltransferase regulatory subunit [Candidatus Doudnabacteria bacterium]|nr:ATP phosphoribosyltransferase regulatory subunit [Candidatus Doudnabacteria bacterium]